MYAKRLKVSQIDPIRGTGSNIVHDQLPFLLIVIRAAPITCISERSSSLNFKTNLGFSSHLIPLTLRPLTKGNGTEVFRNTEKVRFLSRSKFFVLWEQIFGCPSSLCTSFVYA